MHTRFEVLEITRTETYGGALAVSLTVDEPARDLAYGVTCMYVVADGSIEQTKLHAQWSWNLAEHPIPVDEVFDLTVAIGRFLECHPDLSDDLRRRYIERRADEMAL